MIRPKLPVKALHLSAWPLSIRISEKEVSNVLLTEYSPNLTDRGKNALFETLDIFNKFVYNRPL